MNVYVAAPWVDRQAAREAGELVEKAGHTVTEKWWDHPDTSDHDELVEQAKADVVGVLGADLFLLLNTRTSEGKAVETGIAIMCCIPIAVVGERSNLFHHLDDVQLFGSVQEVLDAIERALDGN